MWFQAIWQCYIWIILGASNLCMDVRDVGALNFVEVWWFCCGCLRIGSERPHHFLLYFSRCCVGNYWCPCWWQCEDYKGWWQNNLLSLDCSKELQIVVSENPRLSYGVLVRPELEGRENLGVDVVSILASDHYIGETTELVSQFVDLFSTCLPKGDKGKINRFSLLYVFASRTPKVRANQDFTMFCWRSHTLV
jgi:hypothetical protein